METLRSVLVVVHVTAGSVGLVLGLLSFRPRPGRSGPIRLAYSVSIGVLLLSLVGMLVIDLPELPTGVGIGFSALGGLAAVMLYRIVRAFAEAANRSPGWTERYVAHVFFTYISLWIGFLVLPALRLPYPQVSVPLVAVATLLIGQTAVRAYHRKLGTGHRKPASGRARSA